MITTNTNLAESWLTTTVPHDLIKNEKRGALTVCLPMVLAKPAVPVSIVTFFAISGDVISVIPFTPHPKLGMSLEWGR